MLLEIDGKFWISMDIADILLQWFALIKQKYLNMAKLSVYEEPIIYEINIENILKKIWDQAVNFELILLKKIKLFWSITM